MGDIKWLRKDLITIDEQAMTSEKMLTMIDQYGKESHMSKNSETLNVEEELIKTLRDNDYSEKAIQTILKWYGFKGDILIDQS